MNTEQKIYKNGEKIIIYENEEEKSGAFIEFIYIKPSFEDMDMLYSLYQKAMVDCASKLSINVQSLANKGEENLTEEEKNAMQNYHKMGVMHMKTDKTTRAVWNDCLSRCLINNALYPMAIQLDENAPFIDKIRMLILGICIASFTSFIKPLNGK